MKTLIILLMLCSIADAEASMRRVFINKTNTVEKGQEAGHTAYGDVVDIVHFTDQYEPTKSEFQNYHIVIVDLSDAEVNELISPKTEIVQAEEDGKIVDQEITLEARKKNVDLSEFNLTKDTESVSKETFINRTIDKSAVVDK